MDTPALASFRNVAVIASVLVLLYCTLGTFAIVGWNSATFDAGNGDFDMGASHYDAHQIVK